MIVTGMAHFQNVCKRKLSEWYDKQEGVEKITPDNVFVVWSCKTLQNYKLLAATTVSKTCTRKYRIHATRRNKKDESNAITANGWQN